MTETSKNSNVIAAFGEEHVKTLTGLTARQLAYWRRTGFFKPTFMAENQRMVGSRIYTFRDVLSLRVLQQLRERGGVPLQELRKVAEQLKALGDEKWTAKRLYAHNKRVVLYDEDDKIYRELRSGQGVFDIALIDVVEDLRQGITRLSERDTSDFGRLERKRGLMGGELVIKGTRIPVASVKSFGKAGYSVAQIIEQYPGLHPEDVRAALNYDGDGGKGAKGGNRKKAA